MGGINKVFLLGNLGADPDVRYTPGGEPVANLRLATSKAWRDKATGERKEKTEWHRVVLFRGLAGIAENHLRKGDKIHIEGSLQTRKWQDKTGADRWTTEVVADSMEMLGGSGQHAAGQDGGGARGVAARPASPQPSSGGASSGAQASSQQGSPVLDNDDYDDSVPF